MEKLRRHSKNRGPAAALIFSLCLLAAQQDLADSSARIKAVMLVSESGPYREKAMAAVRAQLIDLPVILEAEETDVPAEAFQRELEAKRIADKHGAQIVFWTDPTDEDQIVVYVAVSPDGGILKRAIDTKQESMDARVEAMAVIVRATVQTLVAKSRLDVDEKPGPEETPAPLESNGQAATGEARSSATQALGVAVAYGFGIQGDEALAVHGARLGLMVYLGEFIRLVAGYRFEMPVTVSRYSVRTTVYSHPVEIGAAVFFPWRRFSLQLGVGTLIDSVTWQVRPEREGVVARSDKNALRIAVSPNVALDFPITAIFSIYLGVAADISATQRHFSINSDEGVLTIYDPWIIRPYFQAGFTVMIL